MGEQKKSQSQPEIRVEDIGVARILIGFIKTRILGIPDPLYEKLYLLKKIKSQLKKINIDGIHFNKNKLKPKLASYFFQIYRFFHPLRKIIDFAKPSKVKDFIYFLVNEVSTDKQKELIKQLTTENFMLESIANIGSNKTSKKIKELYKELSSSYTKEQSKKINYYFSLGESFHEFLKFDLYTLIKKFAPDFKEENTATEPNFREVDIKPLISVIKEFVDHIYMLNLDANYYDFIQLYSKFINKEIIPVNDFQMFFKSITSLVKNNYLLLLVQFISKDVFFRPFHTYTEKNAMNDFLKDVVNNINLIQKKVSDSLKTQSINKLLQDLFGQANFREMTHYTAEQVEYLMKHHVEPFSYTEQMNVLKKFMLDKYNRYIRKTVNTFIVKAGFVSATFQEKFNSLYYQANGVIDKLLDFEKKLQGKDGWDRIVSLIRNKGVDPNLIFLARKNVLEFNQDAKNILFEAMDVFENLKNHIKIVVEAYNKGSKEHVSNIKNFASTSTQEVIKYLAQSFNDISKLLNYFSLVLKASAAKD